MYTLSFNSRIGYGRRCERLTAVVFHWLFFGSTLGVHEDYPRAYPRTVSQVQEIRDRII